ncbi:MAG: efflux RND transporter permease subunit [Planctomycetaceae bacterium]|nr:efflux RND transporter permease subunit [Planctomycetaceae bacterium]
MFNHLILFSLRNRLLVFAAALLLMAGGAYQMTRMTVDVLPNLNRSRVIVIAECPGMAPEEIETLVTIPLETVLNGTAGMQSLRSTSYPGLVTIYVEFDWSTNDAQARQIVSERLQLARGRIPEKIVPQLAPPTSVMGQVMMLAVRDITGTMSPMELRTIADWVIRKRLLALSSGVSEVFVMGGDLRQYQVLLDTDNLIKYGVTLEEVETAIEASNQNVTGGYLRNQGDNQKLVRVLGRIESINDLKKLVVKPGEAAPVSLGQVAEVIEGAAVKIGDASAYTKDADGKITGGPAVVLTIGKQPQSDTKLLTNQILKEIKTIEELVRREYPGFRIEASYMQQRFIDLAIANVREALWIGALLVLVVLVLFLSNLRATVITIVAMPLSIVITCLVFTWFNLSINTMTLGGLAVAIGELVDDAIVDVENIFRRLRENYRLAKPRSTFVVVFEASREIRNSIVYGTVIVVLVFIPLFFLTGIEGRLFQPLGLAYIVSLLASLVVSLTVTPVMSFWLLPKVAMRQSRREGIVVRTVKRIAGDTIRLSLTFPRTVIAVSALMAVAACIVFLNLGRDFMPPFNEGVLQVNVDLLSGRSLETTVAQNERLVRQMLGIEGISGVLRKTGRSELDDHVVPVNTTEYICNIDPNSKRTLGEIVEDVEKLTSPDNMPGTVSFYDQPLQHTISHLRSGVRAKIAVKITGDDLGELRRRAERVQKLIEGIPDIGTVRISPQPVDIPQLQIALDRDKLLLYGLPPDEVSRHIEIAMSGKVLTQVIEGQSYIDVIARLHDRYRENLKELKHLTIPIPTGGGVPLESLTKTFDDEYARGPGQIEHEGAQRQLLVQCNPSKRGSVDVKNDIEKALAPARQELEKDHYSLELAGLFQSEQEASLRMISLSVFSLLAIFLVLYTMFKSANISLQIMAALPMALVGAVIALVLTGQHRTIPNLVGMISLLGIASRNGILLIDHYFHLVMHEGETWSKEMMIRAGKDRVSPVLMTALTSSIGLIPLTLSQEMPGREILYPIATVVIGGLFTSTIMEFFIRPALFWQFGLNAAKRSMVRRQKAEEKEDAETAPSSENR